MNEVVITLRERASIEGREGYPTYAAKLQGAADFLESLASEEEEPLVTKTIVIDPGRGHTSQCPFWTGAGAERHCGICPPDIELGHCFGSVPDWCPLPVLVKLKTPEEPEKPKVETDEESSFLLCPYCGFRDGVEYEESTNETHYRHWYRCFKCGSRGPRAEARDAAKCRWNTRATLPRTSPSAPEKPKVEEDVEYLPCPHCGSHEIMDDADYMPPRRYWCLCMACRKVGPSAGSKQAARVAWNQYARSKQPKVESLREACERFRDRPGSYVSYQVDGLAIVLRELDWVLEWLIRDSSADLDSPTMIALCDRRGKIKQMREGCAE